MTALTTRQRDLLMRLLAAGIPVGMADLAEELKLSPRQISYNLKSVGYWLAQKQITLRVTPGVGIDVQCPAELRSSIVKEISSAADLQLVLSGKQRQQLLALELLTATDPLIIYQLQRQAQVSRTTIIADLTLIESWLGQQGLRVERKPNFGICLQGSESAKRQALLVMLWGDPALGEPLTRLTHTDGLTFDMADDRDLLLLVSQADALIRRWDIRKSAVLVAEAEARLGGRFSDDAVLYLALAFAVQAERVQGGNIVEIDPRTLAWLETLQVWPIAGRVAAKLAWLWPSHWPASETGWVGMHLLAAPRNESWHGDAGDGKPYVELVAEMMRQVAGAYGIESLGQDQTLREGLTNHVIPACLRQCFGLPMLPLARNGPLKQDFAAESAIARKLVALVHEHLGVILPESEVFKPGAAPTGGVHPGAQGLRAQRDRRLPQRHGDCPADRRGDEGLLSEAGELPRRVAA